MCYLTIICFRVFGSSQQNKIWSCRLLPDENHNLSLEMLLLENRLID